MSKTVKLSRSYTVGSAIFDAVLFREPRLIDYRQIGKVVERQGAVIVTYSEAVWAYADRLIEGVPAGAIGELDLTDALAVEDGIIGFFLEASRLWRERENSSSGSAGDQATSTN